MNTPGRPREFDPDETLSKIMQLFWEHGYEATGLSDIIAATGLGKASLYSTFGNKQSMYIKALVHYETLKVGGAVSVLRSSGMKPLDRINAFLSAPILAVQKQDDKRGCFLCNAAADRASLDAETAEIVQRGYEKMRAATESALKEEFASLAPGSARAQSQLVISVYSGLRIMARSGLDAAELTLAKEAALAALG